jgi:phage baseplate assembly protein W
MNTDFIGSGWAFPVGVDSTGRIALSSGDADLEQAIQLILRTYPGERPMRWEFGSRLRDHIFDGTGGDTAAAIRADVQSSLARWEPRIAVTDVEVEPDPDQPGVLYIDIRYTVKATNDSRNLVFPFYTIPDGEN